MTADLHIHSSFSIDSKMDVFDICRIALEKKIDVICLTDHLDLSPADEGFGFYRYEDLSRRIAEAKEEFGGKLTILKGVEFGEPHLHEEEFLQALSRDYDMVMASVHCVEGYFIGGTRFTEKHSVVETFDLYYREVLALVEFGGFDVLAHVDFPKRYIGTPPDDPPIVDEIAAVMARESIAMEINTSPLRKGMGECSPDVSILERYIGAGGRRVTIGSDAHRLLEIASGFDIAETYIRGRDVSNGYFKNRRFVPIG
jgi:histidinol-phosphatase (PHP family)